MVGTTYFPNFDIRSRFLYVFPPTKISNITLVFVTNAVFSKYDNHYCSGRNKVMHLRRHDTNESV